MATAISRRTALTGVLAGALVGTACRAPGAERSEPSPAVPASSAPPPTQEQDPGAVIQQQVLARLAAAGITSINVVVDSSGPGGAAVFVHGSIQTVDDLVTATTIGYEIATEHPDYSVLATFTRPGTGKAGSRALSVMWSRDSVDQAPAPKQLRTYAPLALSLFPTAREDTKLDLTSDLDGLDGSVLVTGTKTTTAAVAATYRRLRPAWRAPTGVSRSSFSVGSDALFLAESAMDLSKRTSAPLPPAMLRTWTSVFHPHDDASLTITTHDDGSRIVKVRFTGHDRRGLSTAALARAFIDAHGDSSADLVIEGTKGDASIDFDAQYCDKRGSAASRAAYAHYASKHPQAATRHHLNACR